MNILEKLQSALSDRYRVEKEIGVGGMATVYLPYIVTSLVQAARSA